MLLGRRLYHLAWDAAAARLTLECQHISDGLGCGTLELDNDRWHGLEVSKRYLWLLGEDVAARVLPDTFQVEAVVELDEPVHWFVDDFAVVAGHPLWSSGRRTVYVLPE